MTVTSSNTGPAVEPTADSRPPGDTAVALRYDALLGSLAERVTATAVGRHIPVGTRLINSPQSRLWLGMLTSEPQLISDQQSGFGYHSKIVPAAQGFSFRVAELPATLNVTVSAVIYLALHPTVEEQRAAVNELGDGGGDGSPGVQQPPGQSGSNQQGHKLAQVWVKAQTGPIRFTVDLPAGQTGSWRVGVDELTAAFTAAAKPPAGSSLFRSRRLSGPPGSLPRDDDMLDARTWARYAANELLAADDVLPARFSAAVQVDVNPLETGWEVLLTVINTTPELDAQTIDGTHPLERDYFDPLLYEVSMTADVDRPLVPYELEQVAQSYRYNRHVPAFGHACAVGVADNGDGTSTLSTLFAAEQQTKRVDARERFTAADGTVWPIDVAFDKLTADPVGAVVALVAAHRAWVEQEWSSQALDRLAAERGWDDTARKAADADARAAREEVEWVQSGLDLLQDNDKVRDAFVYANRVVQAAAVGLDGKPTYTAWRPFQVAWIVGSLPDMVNPASHQDVNIVWFATGGGKSEAYLGLMIATLFYGRLNGVTAGAQVWARFPLRLLALQQTERFARMVFQAELLRAKDPRISGGDRFGIGYFVGGGNTPNRLLDPSSPYFTGLDPNDPETAEACRVLDVCPLCGNTSQVSFDSDSWTMRHICRTAGCRMNGVLPVWGVDDDIYRNAPAVLVGTVDKLAQLGQARQFQVLLGRAASRCPKHGYTGITQCAVFGCTAARAPIPDGMGAVRLEIADELHLLDESLGALDGMYETLLQAISTHLGNEPMQIVGATATIEGYQAQVDHLYQRTARRFPVTGPHIGETFWSTTHPTVPLRRFLGVQPRRITMVTAAREVALSHAAWLADLLENPIDVLAEAGLDPTDPANLEAAGKAGRDLYEVLLAYCLRNEDLSSFTRDDDVHNLLSNQSNLATINGDAEPAAIRDAVQRLVDPPDSVADRVRIIAATKAIGHGFDVARLGVMTVMGTPTSAAEIIQASARVGRKWPGLVVYIINPTRDRDVSVYRYFSYWISFLDRLVHKVPVNRESLPILRRVLSGGLMAWLLQVHDRGWVTGGPRRYSLGDSTAFRDAVAAGYLDHKLLVENLRAGFGVPEKGVLFAMHRDAIECWVANALTTLPLSAEGKLRLPALLTPPVPRSLRDIEEPITIYADL